MWEYLREYKTVSIGNVAGTWQYRRLEKAKQRGRDEYLTHKDWPEISHFLENFVSAVKIVFTLVGGHWRDSIHCQVPTIRSSHDEWAGMGRFKEFSLFYFKKIYFFIIYDFQGTSTHLVYGRICQLHNLFLGRVIIPFPEWCLWPLASPTSKTFLFTLFNKKESFTGFILLLTKVSVKLEAGDLFSRLN